MKPRRILAHVFNHGELASARQFIDLANISLDFPSANGSRLRCIGRIGPHRHGAYNLQNTGRTSRLTVSL